MQISHKTILTYLEELASQEPEKRLLGAPGRWLDAGEVFALAEHVGTALRRMRLCGGAYVAFSVQRTLGSAIMLLGLRAAGAVAVLLDPRQDAAEALNSAETPIPAAAAIRQTDRTRFCITWLGENGSGEKEIDLLSLAPSEGAAVRTVATDPAFVIFKYWDFMGETVSGLLASVGVRWQAPVLHLILPVGISFYTFQTMSYTIDVYRGKVRAERDPVAFALFVSYFPQLVAGPIEKPGDLLPQLKAEHHWNAEDFSAGLRLLLCGFFRKCVVADQCGVYVNAVFSHLESANAFAVAAAGALFFLQIYCDFAGYSEIAAGSARLMGVRLTRNFDRPLLSQSYTEFFRRWHISLNRWFTQYLYIPLGGSRRGPLIKMRNTLIVFGLCGLWHGANWTYVLWGLYAALFVCLESLLEKPAAALAEKWRINLEHPLVILARRTYMFFIFVPGALLFRAVSVSQIGTLFGILFRGIFP